MSTQLTSATSAASKFKQGDKVRITRAISGNTEGWKNAWVPEMNSAVGKTATVLEVGGESGVRLDVPGIATKWLFYPQSVLELVDSRSQPRPAVKTTPVTSRVAEGFFVGQRVTVNSPNAPEWNGPAVVKSLNFGGSVSVKPESGKYAGQVGAFSVDRLAPILLVSSTPSVVPIPAPKTLFSKSAALKTARQIAVELATKNGKVTADDVQFELQNRSINLGNAAGKIFSGFVNSGLTVNSKREGNNGRRIVVWQLTASPAPRPIEPAKKFVIEHRYENGAWRRSYNRVIGLQHHDSRLQEVSFTDRTHAEAEAVAQQEHMVKTHGPRYEYRAVPVN